MFNSIIDTFINLDEPSKNKVINILGKIVNPIKLYLIAVIFLLLIMCVSNYYLYKKISGFIEFNKVT